MERLRLYNVTRRMWPREELESEEFAVVEQLKYETYPYRLCCLHLAQLNLRTNRPTRVHFQVR